MKKYVSCLCVLFVLFGFCSLDALGAPSCRWGSIELPEECPSWVRAFDREGTEGGQLTVELDACQISEYEVCTKEQNSGAGYLADLEPGDMIIVWDEDPCHGGEEYFTFNGTYIAEEPDYVQLSTTDSGTNWAVYTVTVSGTLTITNTGKNEHEAIHLKHNLLDFEKTDDVDSGDCNAPGDDITYTICWNNTSESTFEDANIIDYLPEGVDYDWLISVIPYVTDPNYNLNDHTYTWKLGTIAPNDSGCVSLTVTVNEQAEPGMDMRNRAEMWADPNILVAWNFKDTLVCCWVDDPNIIYVDMTATGSNSGIDWLNAYSGQDGLQRALARVNESTCEGGPYTIYVAAGTYSPGNYASDSFRLGEGSSVYGGFMAGGSDESGRNPYMYETVLTGYTFIDDDPCVITYYEYNDTVVTMVDEYVTDANFPEENTLLDGFTITDAVEYGIYGTGVDFTIVNCTVTDCGLFDGIRATDANVIVEWSKIENSGWNGIRHEGVGNKIIVENSQIVNNKERGIFTTNSTPTIKNSVVFGNGYEGSFEGVRILLPTEVPVLYNNTIVYNAKEGIYCYDDENSEGDPNQPDYPDIQNSILYYNNDGGAQVAGFDQDACASYCDIEGGNEVNNNINDAPGFMLVFDPCDPCSVVNPYHYHLAYDSPCKDMGNPGQDANELGLYDLDGEDRIANGRVDIGADEINSCDEGNHGDIFNDLDWNLDGTVDSYELGVFAGAWLTHDPNDPGIITDPNFAGDPDYVDPATLAMWRQMWDPSYNLDGDYDVDYGDFAVFAQNWLWRTCWKQSWLDLMETMAMGGGESMAMSSPMAFGFVSLAEPEGAELATAQLDSLIEKIYGMIEYFDNSIEEGHENAENLYEMKAFLESVLLDLQGKL